MDVAASIQAVTEEVVLRIGRHVRLRTGLKHLVLAGGVALNCVANGRLLREGDFDDTLDPAGSRRCRRCSGSRPVRLVSIAGQTPPARRAAMPSRGASSARASRPSRSCDFLSAQGTSGQRFADETICSTTSPACWLTAKSSAGSRAGWNSAPGPWCAQHSGRSSLAGHAGHDEPQDQVPREFSPICTGRFAGAGSRMVRPEAGPREPLHALGGPVLDHRRVPVDAEALQTMQHDPDLRRRVNVVRSEIPAVTHVDYSAGSRPSTRSATPAFTAYSRPSTA